MTKTIAVVITIFFAALNLHAIKVSDQQVKQALERLDKELDRRGLYISARQSRIDSLNNDRIGANTHGRLLKTTMELANEYTSFNNDSAIFYFDQGYRTAVELNLDSLANIFRLKRATYMPLAAFIDESIREYSQIDTLSMADDLKELYYDSGRQLYSYISSFYAGYPESYEHWHRKSMDSQKSLLAHLDHSSSKFKLNKGEYHFSHQEYSKAKAILVDLLSHLPEDDNLYARASHILADIAKARGEHNEYVYYLALSAISDTKGATLEVMSLQELGELLFGVDDVDRAHRYLSTALASAVSCHASMRMIQSSSALPVIEEAHNVEVGKWRKRIYLVLGGLALVILLLGGVLLFLRREMHKMSVLQGKLKNANDIKEVYMSQFLNLSSIYMDKLNQFSETVNRKIAANKVDDLYKIIKSGKFVEEQSKQFYEVFDNAFLHIYPKFVESVNDLLRPEMRIKLKEGELLNTDLRILAFMRLGIKESTRIAQVLNYSVHTIYTYRNKLKNSAFERDNFENDIMKISSIS